ncbi:hypothetical protein NSK_007327 [Nannochloropsis salina CCMP1776]|uniref:Uncharacterized protein n=1 Tax=Nannochloropsis salina CCMP1776 TaxID=1027361 RepID=A0A4D9CRF5_9STRA|nr:hypothetical protein NSK_007327 [Nannochloropsis salina CCMP1776]|eukprot:TFJ81366.1 hypothetical protein NSK_007327 [Nannochloropsis salina CCMP1776]
MVSASAFKPSTPSPYQRDLSRGIRKHNRDDGPEASADDDFTHDHGMVVVVVNEKCTKFYHGLMRPPITSQAPTSTYVHPADPWRMKTQQLGHPRQRRSRTGLYSTNFGPREATPGSSQQPDRDHYMRAIEQHLTPASRALLIGHGKGKGDAIDILLKDITNTRPQLAEKITEKIHVDDSHLTDRQVLQLARRIVFGEDPRKPRRIHGQALPPSEFGALDFRGL